jgi:hypothetical protein
MDGIDRGVLEFLGGMVGGLGYTASGACAWLSERSRIVLSQSPTSCSFIAHHRRDHHQHVYTCNKELTAQAGTGRRFALEAAQKARNTQGQTISKAVNIQYQETQELLSVPQTDFGGAEIEKEHPSNILKPRETISHNPSGGFRPIYVLGISIIDRICCPWRSILASASSFRCHLVVVCDDFLETTSTQQGLLRHVL